MTETPADRRERLLAMAGFAGVALSALIVASIFAHATLVNRETSATVMKSVSENSPSALATEQGKTVAESTVPAPAPKSTLPFSQLNRCEAPLAAPGPSSSGLVLTVDFPAWASTHDGPIIGTATLTNTSDEIRRGGFEGPNVALSRDGIVQWHTPRFDAMALSFTYVDLAPGESRQFGVEFRPEVCSTADDRTTGNNWIDQPRVASGQYEVSAYFKFSGYMGDMDGFLNDVDGQSPGDGAGSTISEPDTIVLD